MTNKRVLVVGENEQTGVMHAYTVKSPAVLEEAIAQLALETAEQGERVFFAGHLIGMKRTQTLEEFVEAIGRAASTDQPTAAPEPQPPTVVTDDAEATPA